MGTLDVDGTINESCAGTLDTGGTGGEDSVIGVSESMSESVSFPEAEEIVETMTESVTVVIT